MEDDELQAIRARRMAQMQQGQQQGPNQVKKIYIHFVNYLLIFISCAMC